MNTLITTEIEKLALTEIANQNKYNFKDLYIGRNEKIYHLNMGYLQCICSKGSPYWHQIVSQVATELLICRAKTLQR